MVYLPLRSLGYRKDCNGLKPLWDIPVADLERLTVVNFVKQASVSAKTLRNRLSVLRSALDAAITDKVIRLNPLAGFKINKHMKVQSKVSNRKKHEDVSPFSPREIADIISVTSGTEKAIVSFWNDTGVRPSELIALKKEDVCLVTLEVTIYDAIVHGHTKGPKTAAGQRVIPISQEVAVLLEAEMDSHESDYVFLNSRARPWNADSFRKHQWKTIMEKAKVRYRYPYQLRHTFATRLISEGVNLWKISKLMGHSSPQQLFEHYGNYIEEYEKMVKREEARKARETR